MKEVIDVEEILSERILELRKLIRNTASEKERTNLKELELFNLKLFKNSFKRSFDREVENGH